MRAKKGSPKLVVKAGLQVALKDLWCRHLEATAYAPYSNCMHAMGNPAPAIDADPPHEIDRRRFLTLKSHYPSGEARGTLGSSRRRSWSPGEPHERLLCSTSS
ncbi:hypothetical protein BHE74_00022904 [Ensete ventricosum]|nr:hypothetical protein GW17_00014009 [Ensete ventricosum]RWW69489.1 hypothetical protein BHE74_00022904 [Ensete ventricosum]RZR92536.1 hypothetical protein BHM03_00020848 [Ensete ventricosum]